ncbi:hypothetical protein QR680_010090 [Steinernema hermaphroditum]|uniref:Epoxide hydrolase n=1 Tax=Steinernema hermaphroditum TaxID=289476 RepID=A0AA39IPC3_9BILA|nr:hypothetical protein QR680_010090 [Steinernema hermaphroditum]
MGSVLGTLAIALVTTVGLVAWRRVFSARRIIEVPEEGYFGAGCKHDDDTSLRPFEIEVSEDVLDDVKHRLKNSRVGHEVLEDADSFQYGFNANCLREIKEYWLTTYDWRTYERILNSFPQYKTEIEGLNIHFLRVKPPTSYKTVLPLLIVHGWPGNVFEFYKIIPMLTDPRKHFSGASHDFAFEVIAPSIPGYGWSDQPKKSGMNQIATARIFRKLMERLGYTKFFVQGGDWGAVVVSFLAKLYPESVHGVHVNMFPATPQNSLKSWLLHYIGHYFPCWTFNSSMHYAFNSQRFAPAEAGYFNIQATKPDTVGTALNDSPIGLAAYILEKYSSWTNMRYRDLPDGGLTKKFTLGELLTMVMIYWTNNNIVSSQRFYKERQLDKNYMALLCKYMEVPTGYSAFVHDFPQVVPREIAETACNLNPELLLAMSWLLLIVKTW